MTTYDAIVLGCGGIGSAALMHLAERGLRVLGIDRFHPPHDRGSSHGATRIIRQAYFEHSDYVPLVQRAYELWGRLEQRTGRRLYQRTGLLQVGPAEGYILPAIKASAAEHGLALDELTPSEVETRWPGFRMPAGATALLEQRAGTLFVEECVQAQLDEARRFGVELHTNEVVQSWNADGKRVVVRTDHAKYEAAQLVITAGPWAAGLLGELGISLTVLRKGMYWWPAPTAAYSADDGYPAFLFELPGTLQSTAGQASSGTQNGTSFTAAGDGQSRMMHVTSPIFYGFPSFDRRGVKVAEHTGGSVVPEPGSVKREMDPADRDRVGCFAREHLPLLSEPLLDSAVCMYTMSPDGHFIIDRHPEHVQVVFAAGLSGHGFKFAPVLGEALTDLAVDRRTALPIDFLSLSRFQR